MELIHTPQVAWEQELLRLAMEVHPAEEDGHWSARHAQATSSMVEQPCVPDEGYVLAERITRENSKSFYTASELLPMTKRRAVRVLYAFCRQTDDIVDKVPDDAARNLAAWRELALAERPPTDDVLLNAWYGVRAHYRIPTLYVRQLIDGIGLDLTQKRYDSFQELAHYCYGVASTVGLMAMHIIGYRDRTAIPYAVKLGVALQLTNILRDIGEDFSQGRVYLPQQELEQFHYGEDDLAGGVIDERFQKLMNFQIGRTRELYSEAWDGIRLLSPDGRLAIAAAADLYRGILGKIVTNKYDVFHKRAHLNTAEKLRRLPGLWWRVARMG